MSLTKQQRDALSAEDFAVPGKRTLPIHDERHVSMAWAQVGKVSGIDDTERADARLRILARAADLSVDTRAWNAVKAIQLQAMAIDLPEVSDHPNRMPFSGVLLKLNQPSCAAPHGSNGKLVQMSASVATGALDSLAGMAVDFTPDFDGHDPQRKIGVITAASIEGDDLRIEGFIYAADFPKEAADIKANKDALGFSFEAQQIYVASLDTDPLDITSCVFTGAAILLKDKAAYTTTSLAAAADTGEIDMTKEELEAILAAALKPVNDRFDTIEASQAKISSDLQASAEVRAKVEPFAEQLDTMAAQMESEGIGADRRSGHARLLRDMSASMRAEAAQGRTPASYYNSIYAAAEPGPGDKGEPNATTIAAAIEAATKPLNDKIADLTTRLGDKVAAAREISGGPERKTLSPQIIGLLARADIAVPGEGEKLNTAKLDESLRASGLDVSRRMQVKQEMVRAGLID